MSNGDSGATIEDWYSEDRRFPPSPEFVGSALVSDPSIYDEAEADPRGVLGRRRRASC